MGPESNNRSSSRRKLAPRARVSPRRVRVVIAGAVIVALWKIAVVAKIFPVFVLPPPLGVVNVVVKGLLINPFGPFAKGGITYNLGYTLGSAMTGFVVGAVFAILIGSALAEFSLLEKSIMPYFAALQGLPKVALAPLILVWLGVGIRSQLVLAALVTYFPMLVNTVTGLKGTSYESLELFRSLNASRWQTFAKLKFPASLPILLAGMQISAVYSMLGAILAEYAGADRGMGVMILQMQSHLDTSAVFAYLFVLGVAGALVSAAFRKAGRRIAFWTARAELGMAG